MPVNQPGDRDGARRPTHPPYVRDIVANILSMRQQWFRQLTDPRRDIDDECGYPRNTEAIAADYYTRLYEREALAARTVQVFPYESWQVQPTVYESEEGDVTTEFEKAWSEIGMRLRGEQSYYREEKSSPVWDYLRRVDVLSGIGQYGVLLLGLDDGPDLSRPVRMRPPKPDRGGKAAASLPRPSTVPAGYDPSINVEFGGTDFAKRRLLFLRVFPETLATISRFDANPSSPRFGQPEMYSLTLNDPRDTRGAFGLSTSTIDVHWTRVIHVADNLGSSEVFGVPRQRPVFNRLLDLRKLYSGSAEMYWRGAFPGYSLETHPTLGGDVDVDREGLRDMMEDYMNGLQRYLSLMGMSAKSLAPQVVDPTPQILVQIEAICIQLGVPKRVFLGSERGELASSQDDAAWNDKLRQRQWGYLTPRLIVPFVDRLISVGVLPEPESFCVWWPDLTSQSDKEKAHVSFQRTQAIAQYITSGADVLMTPFDYFTRILGMTDQEANSVIEHAKDQLDDELSLAAMKTAQEAKLAEGGRNGNGSPSGAPNGRQYLGQFVDAPAPKEGGNPRDRKTKEEKAGER